MAMSELSPISQVMNRKYRICWTTFIEVDRVAAKPVRQSWAYEPLQLATNYLSLSQALPPPNLIKQTLIVIGIIVVIGISDKDFLRYQRCGA